MNIFNILEIKNFFNRLVISIRLRLINDNLYILFLDAVNCVEHALIWYLIHVFIDYFIFRLVTFLTRALSSTCWFFQILIYWVFFRRSSWYQTVIWLFALFKLLEHFHDVIFCFFFWRTVVSVQFVYLFDVILDLLVYLDFILVYIYIWNIWCSCQASLSRTVSKFFDFLIILKRGLLFTDNIFTRLIRFQLGLIVFHNVIRQ